MTQSEMETTREVTRWFMAMARRNEPEAFAAFLIGGVIANVVGNLSEEYWQKFSECKPCGEVGCDCHLMRERAMPLLRILRDDHKQELTDRADGHNRHAE